MIGLPLFSSRSVAGLLAAAVVAMGGCTRATRQASTAPQPARQAYTDADVHFMSAMIGHHAQAIVMARMAPTHGASRSLQVLAERVINAQEDEIALMQRWLRDRQLPVPEAGGGTAAGEHHMHMPGMLTAEQMKQLDEARGTVFDELFLRFMIQHHRGAVTMVNDLFSAQGAALDRTVFKLAADISADQSSEIDRMEKMLFTVTTGIPVL